MDLIKDVIMNFLNIFKFLAFIIFILLFPVSSFAKNNFNEIVQQVSKEAKQKTSLLLVKLLITSFN